MAYESTNDWVIKNYREFPHYDVPFNVLAEPTELSAPTLNRVTLDLYKGNTFKIEVTYLVARDATEKEAEDEMWYRIAIFKDKYLVRKYG